jgi:uncharacterized membrane protein YbaN (DUF454 family)
MKFVYIAIGSIAVALGIAGVFLPLLPTTPFLLVAAWAFARSSPRLEAWLVQHPRLGPPLAAWRERRAIPTRAKVIAILFMGASLVYLLWSSSIPPIGKAFTALVLAGSATFILTRPSG